MKTWNLGNTTVRNPWRIREGLRLLEELFEGQQWSAEGQALYYRKLVERRLIEPGGDGLPSLETQGINGRKWAAAPNQLGFVRAWARKGTGPVLITPAGTALLAAENDRLQQEVWLRQLLKYKLPSPLEHGSDYEGFEVMPYRLTLWVVYELQRQGFRGITREEIALFLVTTTKSDKAATIIESVREYRKEREKRMGLVQKRRFFTERRAELIRELFAEEFKQEYGLIRRAVQANKQGNQQSVRNLLAQVAAGGKGGKTKKAQVFVRESMRILRSGGGVDELRGMLDAMRLSVRGGTLWDYADTTVRYCAITGLFSLSGDKMILVEERLPLIEQLVAEGFPYFPDDQYVGSLYADDVPRLPTDDDGFLRTYIARLEKRREGLRSEARIEPTVRAQPPAKPPNLLDLKRYQLELESENAEYREILFYRAQSKPESIADIRQYFSAIKRRDLLGGETYLPAFLEWTAWRVFLAINSLEGPVTNTRNFKLDEELNPLHHARGGVADMVFNYGYYMLVVEVTLNTSERQWSAEIEPVPRHVANVMEENDGAIYGLFVAPAIHPDTAHTFFRAPELRVRGEFRAVQIVPLTLDQLESLLVAFDERRFGPADLRALVEELLALREGSRDGVEWLSRVSSRFESWTKAAVA